ncbi:hypothetical protein GLW08_19170 [Pontibacillus yanchengensis]|uniref:Uncharacterized protein n=1 Tax=Pontibacillus yanchengensis TaxID=462910 RepID=A0ACC7VM88_9BACI|nr:recombinase family protein [Pontibacillus yanchengensis]MYL55439.1 hypothetical protein [Pontibacillus yanchengensis]
MDKRKVAVGYIRVSSSMQAEEGLSLEHQENKIQQYCVKNNFKLVDLHKDEGKSGYNVSQSRKRPGLILLLDSIKNKEVDYVIVTKNDRLGRDQEEKAYIKRQCRKNRVEIIYIDQPGLSGAAATPTESLMDSMMDLLDEFYSMNLGMEVKKIHEDLATKGLYTGGKVPIGYKLHERTNENGRKEKILVVDEETAPIIRLIYKMYLNGKGIYVIARYLNEVRALNRGDWKPSGIGEILKNPNYFTRVWNRRESRRVNGKSKPENEWVYAHSEENETIISEEDWMQVQDLLLKKNKNPNAGEHFKNHNYDGRYVGKYMLTGMVECSECGKKYVANRTTSKRSGTVAHYLQCPSSKYKSKDEKCSNSLNMQKLDMIVWKELCNFLTPREIANEIDKALEEEGEKNRMHNEKFKDLQKRIVDKQKQIANLVEVVTSVDLSVDANRKSLSRYNHKLNDLEKEVEELQERLGDMGTPLPEEVKFPYDLDIVKTEYLIEPEYVNHLDFHVVKAIVNTLVEKIVATRINNKETKLEIYFRFNHPNIQKIINFRKTNLPRTQKIISKGKEHITAFSQFLSALFLGFDDGEPSPPIHKLVDFFMLNKA